MSGVPVALQALHLAERRDREERLWTEAQERYAEHRRDVVTEAIRLVTVNHDPGDEDPCR